MPRRGSTLAVPAFAAVVLAALAGCGADTVEGPPPSAPEQLRLTSPAFASGGTIPARFTCEGANVSPPLRWRGAPPGTRGFALLMEDPDAPGGTFVHWTLYEMSRQTAGVDAGRVPAGALQGESSFGDSRYGGPCPPGGDEPHRYAFVVYALRSDLGLPAGASAADVRAAIARKAIARGRLTARFGR